MKIAYYRCPTVNVEGFFFLKIQTWIHFMVIYRAAMTAKCESEYNLKCMFLNSGRKSNNLVVETALPLCNQNTSMQRFFTVTSGSLFYVLPLIWLFQFHKSKIKQVTCLWAVFFFVFLCVCIYIMYTKIMKLNKRQQDAQPFKNISAGCVV